MAQTPEGAGILENESRGTGKNNYKIKHGHNAGCVFHAKGSLGGETNYNIVY